MCANNISCISEFTPVRFPNAQMIYKFLHSLFRYHLCCFLAGTYVLFTSGCQNYFDGISVYIAMRDVPLLSYIFQKFHYPNFLLDQFSLSLPYKEEHDVWHYVVSFENFVMPVIILGIDTTKHFGLLSNIDLVHFVCEHFFVSVTKNSHWLSHLAALLSFQNCCF